MQKQIYEKHIHDDPDFPFFFHVRMQAVPYSPDLFHWHESIELLYVLEGTLRAVCGEEVVTARAGDLVIVPPNALHAVCADGAPAVYHCLIVDKSFSDGLKLYLSGMRFRPCAASPEAGELFGRITAEVTEKRALYKLSVRSYVMALLVFLCRDCRVAGEEELPGRGTHKIEMVKTVIEYLRLHFGEDLSIEDLCGVVGFSKYYLVPRVSADYRQHGGGLSQQPALLPRAAAAVLRRIHGRGMRGKMRVPQPLLFRQGVPPVPGMLPLR